MHKSMNEFKILDYKRCINIESYIQECINIESYIQTSNFKP